MAQWIIVCNQDTAPSTANQLNKPGWNCPQSNASVVQYVSDPESRMFPGIAVQDILFVVACVVLWAMGYSVGVKR